MSTMPTDVSVCVHTGYNVQEYILSDNMALPSLDLVALAGALALVILAPIAQSRNQRQSNES